MLQQFFSAMNIKSDRCQYSLRLESVDQSEQQTHSSGLTEQSDCASFNTVSTAHAVNLLSTHIPEFGGSEAEDVESWISTIERVAQIHGVTNDTLLLAATGKLKDKARKWFDLNIILI